MKQVFGNETMFKAVAWIYELRITIYDRQETLSAEKWLKLVDRKSPDRLGSKHRKMNLLANCRY